MSTALLEPSTHEWTATELRRLPPFERDAILKAAAELAEGDYTHDKALTDFNAYREGDVHGRSSNTESR